MHRLATPFWNGEEQRLRALWRLLLQFLLLLILLLLLFPLHFLLATVPPLDRLTGLAAPALMVVAVWLASRALDHRSLTDLGLRLDRLWWRDCGFGSALGLLAVGGACAVARTAGWIEYAVTPDLTLRDALALLLWGLLEFSLVAIGEELTARGYQLRNLAEGLRGRFFKPPAAIGTSVVVTSVVFALLHFPGNDVTVLGAVNTILAGVLLGIAVVYTGRLGLAMGFHLTWNVGQGCICGLPVSGNAPRTALLTVSDHGPPIWTGGTYGLEGGGLGTAAFALALAFSLVWIRVTNGPLRLETALTEYTRPPGA